MTTAESNEKVIHGEELAAWLKEFGDRLELDYAVREVMPNLLSLDVFFTCDSCGLRENLGPFIGDGIVIVDGKPVFHSDSLMYDEQKCIAWCQSYADDSPTFPQHQERLAGCRGPVRFRKR